MTVQRKRFRIEEMQSGGTPVLDDVDGDLMPFHNKIMSELRAIREQMARAYRGDAQPADDHIVPAHDAAEAQAMLDSYRAQIAQCEKLKVELDLIHDAITRTKQEIAVLHGTSFSGEEMSKVTGERSSIASWKPSVFG